MKPFIKWAGGKRWLVGNSSFEIPSYTGQYIEPFLGGGAVFFHLQPEKAILSDINPKLIEVYIAVRDNWQRVESELQDLQRQHCTRFYYKERSRKRRKPYTRAAQFLYLNRTCYNGLYRENLTGQFNVPIGTKDKIIFDEENFEEISKTLKHSKILSCDFEETIAKAKNGDLIFADPPYTTAHNLNGFVKYNQRIFSWKDQIRLRNAIVAAVNRGAKVMLTNADHSSVRELYQGEGKYRSLERATVISGKSAFRQNTTEALYVFE